MSVHCEPKGCMYDAPAMRRWVPWVESLSSTPISGESRTPNRVLDGYDGMRLSRLSKNVRKSMSYTNFCALIAHEISVSRVNIFSLCIIIINKTE